MKIEESKKKIHFLLVGRIEYTVFKRVACHVVFCKCRTHLFIHEFESGGRV